MLLDDIKLVNNNHLVKLPHPQKTSESGFLTFLEDIEK